MLLVGPGIPLEAQSGVFRDGNRLTMEVPPALPLPPGHTSASWQLKRRELELSLEKEKIRYGELALTMAQELHQCFRTVSDRNKMLRLKEAARRHAFTLFRDARGEVPEKTPYYGLLPGPDGQVREGHLDLDAYLDLLLQQSASGEAVNSCWALPGIVAGKAIAFEPAGFYRPVLLANGEKHPDNLVYQVYRGTIPVRERIGFLHQGQPVEKFICKEMFFEMRCLADPSASADARNLQAFYWQVSFVRISKVSDGKSCSLLPEVSCSLPEADFLVPGVEPTTDSSQVKGNPSGVRDSIQSYKPVSALAYLVPGVGLRHFSRMKAKQASVPLWPLVGGLWLGSGVFAIISRQQMAIDYAIHKSTQSVTENESAYSKANAWHHRSLLGAAACLGIWLINDVHVFTRDLQARRNSREWFLQTLPGPPIGQSFAPGSAAAGIRITF